MRVYTQSEFVTPGRYRVITVMNTQSINAHDVAGTTISVVERLRIIVMYLHSFLSRTVTSVSDLCTVAPCLL